MTVPVVTTEHGAVRGFTGASGVHTFLGIPYGAPTGGSRCFRRAQVPPSWHGERDATTFGPRCPQDLSEYRAEDRASFSGPDRAGEDCLVANVWTPGIADGGRRPVMLWLHGGGFHCGSAASSWCDGANLAARGDVVVVSINHRIGVFGFLYLDELCGREYEGSGVAGMTDIVLALEWIARNIERFGGDPGNVTVFGESGGGRKVSVLMGMRPARGLFHRAIIQSGAHPRGVLPALASDFARRLFETLRLEVGDVERLQQVPAEHLLEAATVVAEEDDGFEMPRSGRRMLLSPVVGSEWLPAHPFDPASSCGEDVPLIIGSNQDEATWTLTREPGSGTLTADELFERLRPALGERTGEIIAAHRRALPEATPWDLLVSILSEDRRLLSIEVAERKSGQRAAPAYLYYFTWESDYGLLGAAHTVETPFVFHNVDRASIVGSRPDRYRLADIIADTWLTLDREPGQPRDPALVTVRR